MQAFRLEITKNSPLTICLYDRTGQALAFRSLLPIGAGLGSSAAYSSCVASALIYTHGHLIAPAGGASIPPTDASLINSWAFLAEKVLHGNPSGVDNSVSVHGGALAFTRAHTRNGLLQNEMQGLRGFESVRFLLTDTKVGRDTKKLVAKVGKQLEEEPERVNKRLAEIQAISDEASKILGGKVQVTRAELIKTLNSLIEENHGHLVDLQVSHASLEAIRSTTAGKPWQLSTKLTGAGGGGCAVTLLPDELKREDLDALIKALEQQGFACYETTVGGPGVGLMVKGDETKASQEAAGESEYVPERDMFVHSDGDTLAQWAESQGKNAWAFA